MARGPILARELEEIDQLIRTYHFREAAAKLDAAWPRAKRQRGLWPLAAQLSWRTGNPLRALSLLSHVASVDRKVEHAVATPAETAEYAGALVALGSRTEALGWLKKVPVAEYPRAALYEVLALFGQWRYGESLATMARVADADVDPYLRLGLSINELAAIIATDRYDEAAERALELEARLRPTAYRLFYYNVLELIVQLGALSGRRELIERVESAVPIASSIETIFDFNFRKWSLVFELARGRAARPDALEGLRELGAHALRLGFWEGLREVDYFRCRFAFDPNRYAHLHFGTIYPAYRERLRRGVKVPESFVLPATFDKSWGAAHRSTGRVFLLDEARLETTNESALRPGFAEHRLMQALLSDFYSPLRLGALFELVFPDQYFDASAGPARLYALASRLNTKLRKARVPVHVSSSAKQFQITATEGTCVRISGQARGASAGHERTPYNSIDSWVFALRERIHDEPVSIGACVKLLQEPRRTVQARLQSAVDLGRAVRIGRGKATKYKIAA